MAQISCSKGYNFLSKGGEGGWGVSPDLSHLEPNPENLSHLRFSKDFYRNPVRSDAKRLRPVRDKSETPEREKPEQYRSEITQELYFLKVNPQC